MLLKTLSIENFRGITKLDLKLARTTVLIGENNTGKTSILEAIHTCLTRGLGRRALPFSEYDFHLATDDSDPADAPPVVLTLTFEESKQDEWPDQIAQAFPGAIQTLDDDRLRLTFRVSAKYEGDSKGIAVEWAFLDRNGNQLPTARQQKLVTDLQQLAPLFLLTASREASQHFQAKSSFWAPFTRNLEVTDEKRREIEEQIGQINQSVLDSHRPFDALKDRIAKVGTLVPLSATDLVSVEAVPTRIFDMLARTQVKLASRTGAPLPMAQHGAGTQSLAVLFLFEAFLQSRLAEAYDEHAEPILALEEPESHLHPSAIRALWSSLDELPGQKIIATHSGDLLAAVPVLAIRRLARRNGKVEVFRVQDSTLDEREQQKVSYHVRSKRGALLFARCWLLVEGETEFTMLPELGRAAGHDFELSAVACVEFAQCGLKPLIKVAQDLGIEWHVIADGDAAGATYARTVESLRGGDAAADRITRLAEPDIEHCMWHGGFANVYEGAVDANHRSMIVAAPGTAQNITETIKAAERSTSKSHLAYAVVGEVIRAGSPGVPASLGSAIRTAVALAKRSS